MLEMIGQSKGSLTDCIRKLTSLWRFIFLPFFKVEFLIELFDEFGANEIDKGITKVALILI